MPDLFADPKELIGHARDEIAVAQGLINQFADAQEYARVIKTKAQTGQQVHYLKMSGPALSPKLRIVVKGIAGNLRDALDHAVYSAAVAFKGGEPKDTGFPFAKDAAGVKGEINGRRLSGNPPEIHALLMGFRPYERGNAALYPLNQIRNPNTHRFIVPVGSAGIAAGLQLTGGLLKAGTKFGYSKWNAAKQEIEFLTLGAGSTTDQYKVQVTVNVTFQGIKAVAGKSVIPTLEAMANEVEHVVLDIEAECRRHGVIP